MGWEALGFVVTLAVLCLTEERDCVREGGRSDVHFVDGGSVGPTDEICRGGRVGSLGVPG